MTETVGQVPVSFPTREAGHAGASPVTLPVCDVSDSGVFLSYVMELFLMLLFLYLLL
ncbi:Uncharacterised protein [Escherichia coli]|nr:Uncharacterised protein [Escherichia coli]